MTKDLQSTLDSLKQKYFNSIPKPPKLKFSKRDIIELEKRMKRTKEITNSLKLEDAYEGLSAEDIIRLKTRQEMNQEIHDLKVQK